MPPPIELNPFSPTAVTLSPPPSVLLPKVSYLSTCQQIKITHTNRSTFSHALPPPPKKKQKNKFSQVEFKTIGSGKSELLESFSWKKKKNFFHAVIGSSFSNKLSDKFRHSRQMTKVTKTQFTVSGLNWTSAFQTNWFYRRAFTRTIFRETFSDEEKFNQNEINLIFEMKAAFESRPESKK